MKQFANGPEVFYLGIGSLIAFFMALLRTGGLTRRNLAVRTSEALMCSMLSSSITIGSNVWLGWSYELSTPIGAFVGFVGTEFLRSLLKGFLISKADLDTAEKEILRKQEEEKKEKAQKQNKDLDNE